MEIKFTSLAEMVEYIKKGLPKGAKVIADFESTPKTPEAKVSPKKKPVTASKKIMAKPKAKKSTSNGKIAAKKVSVKDPKPSGIPPVKRGKKKGK